MTKIGVQVTMNVIVMRIKSFSICVVTVKEQCLSLSVGLGIEQDAINNPRITENHDSTR